ncbi:MAG: ferritin [Flammeovirgaceae bacterium]
MKSIVTKTTSLTSEMEARLNEQVSMESASSQYYLACASWLHKEGYEGAAAFMYQHANEERMHMMKLITYINDSGGHALAPEITGIRNHFSSLKEILDYALEHEIEVSHSINNIVDFCFEIKDFATLQFMQWYVQEQREEEQICRRAIEIYEIIGDDAQGLWMIDKEIGKLAQVAEQADANAEGA